MYIHKNIHIQTPTYPHTHIQTLTHTENTQVILQRQAEKKRERKIEEEKDREKESEEKDAGEQQCEQQWEVLRLQSSGLALLWSV